MPTIKLNQETKDRLDSLMADELRSRVEHSSGKEKRELFIQLVRARFGITYNDFIDRLINEYTKDKR